MPNGGNHDDDHIWKAIDGLRTQVQKVSEDAAVTKSQHQTLLKEFENVNARFDRMRNVGLALLAPAVTIAATLVGAFFQGGA